mmetsp:Transcript_73262/g.161759  ORF Transcript_73262/g.161759 Transcript_73262/m.161759 type:complete len:222 (-) Transcript_73262:265-930(-)
MLMGKLPALQLSSIVMPSSNSWQSGKIRLSMTQRVEASGPWRSASPAKRIQTSSSTSSTSSTLPALPSGTSIQRCIRFTSWPSSSLTLLDCTIRPCFARTLQAMCSDCLCPLARSATTRCARPPVAFASSSSSNCWGRSLLLAAKNSSSSATASSEGSEGCSSSPALDKGHWSTRNTSAWVLKYLRFHCSFCKHLWSCTSKGPIGNCKWFSSDSMFKAEVD